MPTLQGLLKNAVKGDTEESKKKALVLFSGTLLCVFIIYFVLFLKPGIAALAGLIPKIRLRAGEIKMVRADLPFKDRLLGKRKDQQETLAKYEKKLSKEKELPMLLEDLSKMARNSRVKILGITPLDSAARAYKKGEKKKEEVYQEVPIRISAESGYHELGIFISKLERSERYLQVSDLKIRASRASPKRHSVEFVVYAYTFRSDE